MAMRSKNAPRRLYKRAGSYVLVLSGLYFGPKSDASTAIDPKVEVTHEVIKPAGGRKRIQVTQVAEGKEPVVEVWTEKHLTFKHRAIPVLAESEPPTDEGNPACEAPQA